MEALTLTTPVSTSRTKWEVDEVCIRRRAQRIDVLVVSDAGEERQHSWTGPVAVTLMNQLNTVNLSTQSLHKRIMNRLIADGVFAGTITGTPDS